VRDDLTRGAARSDPAESLRKTHIAYATREGEPNKPRMWSRLEAGGEGGFGTSPDSSHSIETTELTGLASLPHVPLKPPKPLKSRDGGTKLERWTDVWPSPRTNLEARSTNHQSRPSARKARAVQTLATSHITLESSTWLGMLCEATSGRARRTTLRHDGQRLTAFRVEATRVHAPDILGRAPRPTRSGATSKRSAWIPCRSTS